MDLSNIFVFRNRQARLKTDICKIYFTPFDTFGSAALPIGTYLNNHWERCAPINTTLTYEHLVIQNGFVARHVK